MLQSIYWKPSFQWYSRLAASVVRFDAVRLFPVGLRQVYGLCQQASNSIDRFMLENRQKLGSASVPMLAIQKKLSFIHNGIKQRTFTGIKNFIDIQSHFCFT